MVLRVLQSEAKMEIFARIGWNFEIVDGLVDVAQRQAAGALCGSQQHLAEVVAMGEF